ncbi:MAG TPA: NAD(P)-dependent oxidoreductase [Candidatus Nanoarchaeia archaeon]|nr:NAD(P)-dependent oxidoreductase [Candidatus Nanoarchaeia archaeon]
MKKILIIGGTGYIGREIVKKLRNKNYEVAVLSRKSNTLKDIKCIQCSLLNKELLKEKINGFDVIIYSAGIVRTIMKWKYDENLPGVKNLVEAMNFNNIKKLIYFSTQYVYIDKTGPYGRSKKECDRIIENSGLDYIMVRPDFVYGIDKQHFYKLALLAKKTRILPIIGAAKRLQPINKEDVARVTISLIDNIDKIKPNSIMDLSGKDVVSLNDIADYIEKYLNKKCMKVNIPFSLLKIFKNVLPFDLDSLTGDRLDRKMGNLNIDLKLSHTLEEDLKKIVEKV